MASNINVLRTAPAHLWANHIAKGNKAPGSGCAYNRSHPIHSVTSTIPVWPATAHLAPNRPLTLRPPGSRNYKKSYGSYGKWSVPQLQIESPKQLPSAIVRKTRITYTAKGVWQKSTVVFVTSPSAWTKLKSWNGYPTTRIAYSSVQPST